RSPARPASSVLAPRPRNSAGGPAAWARLSWDCHAAAWQSLADGIQHDHRDLALGLLLVIGVGRPELERLFPQLCPLLARRGPGPRLHLRRPDLHVDLRVGEEVAVPAGMLRRAAFRGDHDVAVTGL